MVEYKPGDVVTARTWRSGDRTILVTAKDEEGDRRPGFTGVLARVDEGVAVPVVVDGVSEVWGYDEQITAIVMTS
jgi:hypothetical protein